MSVLLPIPAVLQRAGHDCGPAVARSILAFFGKPPAGVGRVLRPCRTNGTPPGRLGWLFVAAGLPVEFRHRLSVADLGRAIARGRPVVCPIQSSGEGHWIVVRGVSARRVYLMCPVAGLTAMLAPAFRAVWHDATAAGVRLERFGLIVGG